MMRSGLAVVVSIAFAMAACGKGKGNEGGDMTDPKGSAAAKGDAEVAALKAVLEAVLGPIENTYPDCAKMKAQVDPALASVDPQAKVVRAGLADAEITKRLDDIYKEGTELNGLWKRTYNMSLNCPEVSDGLARAVGRMK